MSSPNASIALDIRDIRAAADRIRPWVHRTPLLTSRSLSERIGVEVRLKCENLQRAGSFKIRGAMNALLQLDDEQRRGGVVAFSSGNHAQGVALAARLLGIKATIVMPENSVMTKVQATEAYGATVVRAGVTAATRDTVAREIAEKEGATVIPPSTTSTSSPAPARSAWRSSRSGRTSPRSSPPSAAAASSPAPPSARCPSSR